MIATMETDLFTTLDESKEWLQENIDGGAICPCCFKLDKVYRRKISTGSVKILARVYRLAARHPDRRFFHSSEFSEINGHEWTKFKHLGLLEEAENADKTKKTSARWSISERGKAFCRGTLRIPEELILYHDKLIGVTEVNKYINEFWPNFNYQELMGAE